MEMCEYLKSYLYIGIKLFLKSRGLPRRTSQMSLSPSTSIRLHLYFWYLSSWPNMALLAFCKSGYHPFFCELISYLFQPLQPINISLNSFN